MCSSPAKSPSRPSLVTIGDADPTHLERVSRETGEEAFNFIVEWKLT